MDGGDDSVPDCILGWLTLSLPLLLYRRLSVACSLALPCYPVPSRFRRIVIFVTHLIERLPPRNNSSSSI